jgi:hypothetical protein
MTPRIPISAVPFALNARQAMGLQGNDVSSTAPDDKDVLTWDDSSSLWVPDVPGARTFPEITAVDNNENPQNFFAEYRNSITLRRIDNNTVEVSPGEVMIDGLMRRRTSSLTIAFSGTSSGPNRGLDTGTAQPNTTYFVYAVADDDEDSFDLIISANANAPTGVTHFRIVGQFATNGSTYIGNVTTLDPGATTQPQRIAFVNNDTQSSPVILTTIPGGMLGTDRVITVDILYEIMTASSGNEGKTWIYFKYGGQDAGCQSKVTGSNNTWFAGVARVTLWANDATNAQKMLIECSGGQTSVDDLTVDSSSDQVLEVTWSVTSGSFKHLATLVSGPD